MSAKVKEDLVKLEVDQNKAEIKIKEREVPVVEHVNARPDLSK